MNLSPLDNPVWHALNSYHDHLAIRGDGTVRYPPDIFSAAATPENSSLEFTNLRGLVETNEIVGVLGALPEDLPGWEVIFIDQARQFIHENLKPAKRVDAVVLTAEDVPEILDLVNLAQPGPFSPVLWNWDNIWDYGKMATWWLWQVNGCICQDSAK